MPPPPSGPTRRRFLQAGAGAALAGGLPLLGACSFGDDDAPTRAPAGKIRRTFFVNHAHLEHAGKTKVLEAHGKHYPMTPVAQRPELLARHRGSNRFLAGLADQHVTHVVEDVEVPSNAVLPVSTRTALGNGQWSVDSIHILFPELPAGAAAGPLPLSHKRRRYGLVAAASLHEAAEEHVLLDAPNHAMALAMLHRDAMAYDATAAHTVSRYAANSENVDALSDTLPRSAPPRPPPRRASPTAAAGPCCSRWSTRRPASRAA